MRFNQRSSASRPQGGRLHSESAVDQLRALLKSAGGGHGDVAGSEIGGAELPEGTVREALERPELLWEELLPSRCASSSCWCRGLM